MRDEILKIDGHAFHIRVAGTPGQPVILFLHGFPEYCGAFDDLLPLLAQDYLCVAPDQRGFGDSWRPAEVTEYALPKLVADMAAVLGHYAPKAPVAAVFGHDWGAAVAYGLAFRHGDLFEKLVVANGVHPVPFQRALAAGGAQSAASQYINYLRTEGSEAKLCENDFARMFRIFSEHMDMSWMTAEKRAAYVAAWGDVAGVRGMVNWYRASPLVVAQPGRAIADAELPELPLKYLQVPMPHLLLWGQNDTALLPECHAGLEAFCADLSRVEIPEADHWILHQKPQLVAQHLRRFLQS